MIMKCRDMERVMAESSQKLLHGGMRMSDWFSDKLKNELYEIECLLFSGNQWSHHKKHTGRPGMLYSNMCKIKLKHIRSVTC